jgi:hypothetical protein
MPLAASTTLRAVAGSARKLLEGAAANMHFSRKCNFACKFW